MKRCPYQGKKKYRTAADAYITAGLIRRWSGVRAYRCPHCGFFHLTHKRKQDRNRRRQRAA